MRRERTGAACRCPPTTCTSPPSPCAIVRTRPTPCTWWVLRCATSRAAIHAAANVENAAYPQSQCAEASAIGVMVAAGGRKITEILVVADERPGLPSPCGACRQRLREFAPLDTPVHLAGLAGVIRSVTMGDLLPFSFGPEYLGREAVR